MQLSDDNVLQNNRTTRRPSESSFLTVGLMTSIMNSCS